MVAKNAGLEPTDCDPRGLGGESNVETPVRKRRGFTLVELLVVVSIVALLVSILLPTLRGARAQAKRAACSGHLRQIGVALTAYLFDYNDRFPFASYLPSLGPAPLETEEPIYIAKVLERYVGHQAQVFRCPADLPGRKERDSPNAGLSYFDSEETSYEYHIMEFGVRPHFPFLGGRSIEEAVALLSRRHPDRPIALNAVWLMRDYDNFHGKAGTPGARRYLFVDGHVGDYEQY